MKTATALTVIAIGAILAFAVTASPGFLNLNTVGWILILTGGFGLAMTPRGQDWLRRKIIVRRSPPGSRGGRPVRQLPRPPSPAQSTGGTAPASGGPASGVAESRRPCDESATASSAESTTEPPIDPPTETIEEYIEH
ncbi:MAG TPA: hypothetical protein VFQ44_15285 [Streptosporangiaceae bacterium]|nr:hypothetical protein [Streptosporangiaceae bacterium]